MDESLDLITRKVNIGGTVTVGGDSPLTLIGGPCSIESLEHSLFMAKEIKEICKSLEIPYIFKSCYNKDCRSSVDSYHGIGVEEGLEILKTVRDEVKVPVTSDVSNVAWMKRTAEVVDLIQIPAYLCRQTHLLVEAGKTGLPVNIKKGQYMAPWDMHNPVKKVESTGNKNILLTDRGTMFGYNLLVSDMRCFPIMKRTGCPVVFDATHSIQRPGSLGESSGGDREHIPCLVRAASAVDVDALFMEIHDSPEDAPCDATTMLRLSNLKGVLRDAKRIDEVIKNE
jgi:2-dehydro-3-deoxyphosphooctonate aldolase (KDO 8-P synthase)